MNNDILALASAANEAVIAYRDADVHVAHGAGLAARLCEAVDALTGAIVEEANR